MNYYHNNANFYHVPALIQFPKNRDVPKEVIILVIKNIIKDANWYLVQEGDARMLLIASQQGQKDVFTFLSVAKYNAHRY